jgi:hypothetical protein
MNTVRRGTKRAAGVFASAKRCYVYTLSNNFSGSECDPVYAHIAYDTFSFAKLQDNGGGVYTVKVHSNEWYRMETL